MRVRPRLGTPSLLVVGFLAATLGVFVPCAVATGGGEDNGQRLRSLEIYFVDTEGGAATLIVTPERESILVDCGNPGERDPGRIARVARDIAGLSRIDHLVITHWHLDHVGGVERLAELIPIGAFYDHGVPEPPTTDIRAQDVAAYRKVTGGKSRVLRPGDTIPLRAGTAGPAPSLRVLAAHGLVLGETGDKIQPPCAKGHEAQPIDGSDNAKSVAFVLAFGGFKFFDGGDLTWNVEHKLVCPENIPGRVDVYQSNHHGLDISNNPALIAALAPRVAVVNNGAKKGAEPGTLRALRAASGLEAVFQLHRRLGGDAKDNSPPELIANDAEECKGEFVKVSVDPDGKSYTVSVPSKRTEKKYAVRS
ncbi:MAG TPA: MBL fold metallo-hydrolase [Planctomycetota bacterium]|nr:MBL fold metallo-hydrolase [Planctomycetota bacterium]